MQYRLFVTLSLAMLLSLPLSALAAGNVLLPSTNNGSSSSTSSSSSLPNLGITAAPESPATPPPPVAAPAPVSPTAQIAAPTATTSTPMPIQRPVTAIPTKPSDIITAIDPVSAAHLAPGQIPTQVIHQPDLTPVLVQTGQNLPYAITISINGKSIFGANDVAAINKKLGLTPAEIPSSCILTLRGLLATDVGSYILSGPPIPQVSIRYSGMIKRYMMIGDALCQVKHLPPGSGFISQYGDRYEVSLQPINCPPPTRQTTQLDITYDGSGKSQCVYQ